MDYSYFTFIPILSALPITAILTVGAYVLYSIGLYGMADHTGIYPSWMAWVPILRLYTLGQLADRYNGSTEQKQTCYRLILPCLRLSFPILSVSMLTMILMGWTIDNLIVLTAFLLMILFTIAVRVVELICYYKAFCDYEPTNAVVYTVLSIFRLEWLALFLCRNNVPVGIAGRCRPKQPRYNVGRSANDNER